MSVTIDQAVIAALTTIIAFSAIAQALFIRKQLEILRTTESREKQVNVVVQPYGHSYSRSSGDHVKLTAFVGYNVINRSVFAVTITSWEFEAEQPKDRRRSGRQTHPVIPTVVEYEGRTLTTLKTPHRLERGELATVMCSKSEVLSNLGRDDGTVTRVRGVFYDTLGNAHRPSGWVEWTEKGVAYHNGPRPGYITPEETDSPLPSKSLRKRLFGGTGGRGRA